MPSVLTPHQLQEALPRSEPVTHTVSTTRQSVRDILAGKDNRLIVVIGPCSIHHPEAALRYAEKLQKKIATLSDKLCIIMRAYVEKSRTALGWKGFINDPHLNNTFAIEQGLQEARNLFLNLNAMGVPVATEIIHPYISAYLSDLISWAAIGARTSESQLHREFASALNIPIGFKNNTNGDTQVAIDAVKTARESHTFFMPTASGTMQLTQSHGNPDAHIVLRGSATNTNYDQQTLAKLAPLSPFLLTVATATVKKIIVYNPLLQSISHKISPIFQAL